MSGLTQIHLAAEEDKDHEPDKWARLFNALTWEDFKMISADNKNMQEAGETLFALNGDDRIRDRCEAREDYRRTWDGVKQEIEELKSSNRKKDAEITELKSSNKNKDSLICSLEEQVATLRQQLQSDIN